MKVTIDKTFRVAAPIDEVWGLLSDPNRVVSCVPGARITETVDAMNFKGSVSMKIGPVVTDFKGDILIEESDDVNRNLILKGSGVDAKGKGTASMTMTGNLTELEDGGTQVATSMEVSVIGKLAQFGSRLMEDVSNRMFEQFVECFETKVTAAPAVGAPDQADESAGVEVAQADASQASDDPEPIKALPLLFSVIGSAIARFFGRLFGHRSEK